MHHDQDHAVAARTEKSSPVVADWPTAPLAGQLDQKLIDQCFARIDDGTYKNIHSVLIVKDGKLLVERYFSGQDENGKQKQFQRNTLQDTASATKSINSILIGIAIDQHLIRNVDEPIASFFPEYSDLFADPGKRAIRLRDLSFNDRWPCVG